MDRRQGEDPDEYMFSRSFHDSARLHLQQHMWNYKLRYHLHPNVPVKEGLKIADIGTGTAAWPIELAQTLPASTKLDGFDISRSLFPAKEYLPKNVTLNTLDAFGEIPAELVGKYDVVHIQAFIIIVKGDRPEPLIENLFKMLKPGGYLQWNEMDCHTLAPVAPNSSVSKVNSEELIKRFKEWCGTMDWIWDWCSILDKKFVNAGLKVDYFERIPLSPEMLKMSTDNYLMAFEDIGFTVLANGRKVPGMGTAPEWMALYRKMLDETANGVAVTMDMIVCLGKKPSS
ncbi:MAG: hypothetical protein M4579_004443 [Chaenotheca gracillima]|nr:MAG: hypothetical protein M4579_004443 [Chaenotheca gracillima]